MAFTAGGRFNFITAKGATSVQEEHFHSVYFAAGTAICLGPTLFIAPSPCEKQDVGHEGVALVTSENLAFLPLTQNSLDVGSFDAHDLLAHALLSCRLGVWVFVPLSV